MKIRKTPGIAARPFFTAKPYGNFVSLQADRQNFWASQLWETIINLFHL
jgi:hypothetical protein